MFVEWIDLRVIGGFLVRVVFVFILEFFFGIFYVRSLCKRCVVLCMEGRKVG